MRAGGNVAFVVVFAPRQETIKVRVLPAAGDMNGVVQRIKRRLFFPDLRQRLAEIADPRTSSVYGIDEIIFTAIAIFLLKEGSRNQMQVDVREHGRED